MHTNYKTNNKEWKQNEKSITGETNKRMRVTEYRNEEGQTNGPTKISKKKTNHFFFLKLRFET